MKAMPTAEEFTEQFKAACSSGDRKHVVQLLNGGASLPAHERDLRLGPPMREVFSLAKQSTDMPAVEIKKLLPSPVHKLRVGALSIMDKQARRKRTSDSHRKELYDLYMGSSRYIDYWDLVDVCAPYVVGGYLFDKSRRPLYKLACSKNEWERRTAIVSTYYFIRQGDLEDTFSIAELLVNDPQHFVQTAVGGWMREAGKQDRGRLLMFLDDHAATMPRTALRYMIEKLDKSTRAHYLARAKEID